MAKYSAKAHEKVRQAMNEMKEGTLFSGGSDTPVVDPKQAIAIGLSEARREGAKIPPEKKASAEKASTHAKRGAKKATPKKKVSRNPTR